MKEDNYNDIINLPRHESSVRKRMSKENRAAQFAPFAALAGFENAVNETARLTDERKDIDDGLKNLLNSKLQIIEKDLSLKQQIIFTHFVHDKTKSGGKYVETEGIVKKIDNIENKIILESLEVIDINEIIDIKGKSLDNYYTD